ncbi:Peptidase M23 [Thiomonas sp. X19]|nr:Peptidase M23 [Thiomonas sp. X19]
MTRLPSPQTFRARLHAMRAELAQSSRAARDVLQAHPRRVALAVGLALMGSGIAAYAIAPGTPDPALSPQTTLTIALQTDAASQAQALDDQPVVLYRTTQANRSDTVQTLLKRLGVTDPATLRQLSADSQMRSLVLSNTGAEISAQVDSAGQLRQLQGNLALAPPQRTAADAPSTKASPKGVQADSAAPADAVWQRLTLLPSADGWSKTLTPLALRTQTRVAAGEIRGTLASAAQSADLPSTVMAQLGRIFADRLNLKRDLRRGDRFAVVYEMLTVDGRPVRTGRVLAAEITSRGKSVQALWFAPRGAPGLASYYTPQGHSLNRVFLPSPMPGAKITSRFGMRFDPVVKRMQLHEGVDFQAAVGTPVRTVADGRVVKAGQETGYGNIVKIDHPGGFETVYAHLSKLDVHAGQQVTAGQIIAKSGNTGWSTGAHLHFEFQVKGQVVDPLKMAQYVPPSQALPSGERASFMAATALLSTQLAQAAGSGSRLASATKLVPSTQAD